MPRELARRIGREGIKDGDHAMHGYPWGCMGVWREADRYGGPFVRYDEAPAVFGGQVPGLR